VHISICHKEPAVEYIIETRLLQMSFQHHMVLKGIDLTINQGEIFGLIGPSGVGKTTLINILTGQLLPTSGEVFVFGRDTKQLGDTEYSQMGMVFDVPGLFERLSCEQNLSIFAEIYGIDKKRISHVLEKVNLAASAKTKVSRLSKGMRQRLIIARAILHSPKLLFLDEPTSGLDPLNTSDIHKLILSLKESGTTIFLTTHKMDEAMSLCDRVALLSEGVLIENDAPDEICRKYNLENSLHILLKNGERVILPNTADSQETISEYMKNEQIASIHSSEPNLEDVFLSVMKGGKKL
jgi:ABC-2 type transport system ATP-binding protein